MTHQGREAADPLRRALWAALVLLQPACLCSSGATASSQPAAMLRSLPQQRTQPALQMQHSHQFLFIIPHLVDHCSGLLVSHLGKCNSRVISGGLEDNDSSM